MPKTKQLLPPMKEINRSIEDLDDGRYFVLADHIYEICSWLPGAPGSGPATQVHILFPLPGPGRDKMVLRLKSARALDEMVGVLLQYRKQVWGADES